MCETLFGPRINVHCPAHNGIVDADGFQSGFDDTDTPP